MVSEVTIGSALEQQSQTTAASTSLAEDFSQFLTLLTVQLQNQDPLDPMDTSEFTNQIVAFTGVEQQINTNQKLDDLVALQLSSSLSSALSYVGLDISYIGNEFNYDGTLPAKINYAMDGSAIDAKVRVLNEQGDILYEEQAKTSAGNNEFVWDGTDKNGNPLPAGTYQVRIDALDANDQPVVSTTVVSGRVRGVETQNGLTFALVGERAIALGNILNASQPDEAPPPEEEEIDA